MYMNNLNYYPLKRVKEKLGEAEVSQMLITPEERKGWSYTFATGDGEYLIVKINHHNTITSVIFTPRYKGIGLSLKRAKRKGYKACWHIGLLPTSE